MPRTNIVGLPVELLVQIFLCLLRISPPSFSRRGDSRPGYMGWYTVAHVCSAFRQVVRDTPLLFAEAYTHFYRQQDHFQASVIGDELFDHPHV